MLKKYDIIYKYTGINVLNIYNSLKTNLDKLI